mgnify:CR=1 FL=1
MAAKDRLTRPAEGLFPPHARVALPLEGGLFDVLDVGGEDFPEFADNLVSLVAQALDERGLDVPVGGGGRLTAASEDVIHSFFVPAFRVKADVIPGRYTTLWFNAPKPGEYHLFCAAYCGTQHSGMIGKVVVMEPNAYTAGRGGGAAEGLSIIPI